MSDMRLLVVEDDTDGQEVVERMLRHHRILHDVVDSGEAALEMLEAHSYQGAVLDLSLPGMDGWTLLRCIKADARFMAIPCVAVTAYHAPDVAVKAIEAGFRAYFPKPLEATSFVRELLRVFA